MTGWLLMTRATVALMMEVMSSWCNARWMMGGVSRKERDRKQNKKKKIGSGWLPPFVVVVDFFLYPRQTLHQANGVGMDKNKNKGSWKHGTGPRKSRGCLEYRHDVSSALGSGLISRNWLQQSRAMHCTY
jgi:hypothetical protein